MLVKTVSFNDFLEEFKKHDRGGNFSYEGKKALFEHLNELSEDIGEPIELDVIGLCWDFIEYESLEQFNKDYGYTIGKDIDSIDDIQEYTILIPVNEEAFIIQDF